MKAEHHDKRLDDLIHTAIGRKQLAFDFQRWKHEHATSVAQFESQRRSESTWFVRLMARPNTKFAAVAAVLVVGILIHGWLSNPRDGLAFGQVLENMATVQTFHAKFNENGQESEIWAKRPNMLRWQRDETVEISNGPTMWSVNIPFNKATRRPSYYFDRAQRRGLDVLDYFIQMQCSESFSGFFSEEPGGRITREDKDLDVYRMEVAERGGTARFEALVDSRTHLLDRLSVHIDDGEEIVQMIEISDIEYGVLISDEMFRYEPPAGMRVVVEEPKEPVQDTSPAGGATLSGVVTWAANDKPVAGARLLVYGGEYETTADGEVQPTFSAETETDANGHWQVAGAPAGPIRIRVRSWQGDWPMVPTFTNNTGSPGNPCVTVDGRGEYTGLNFKVYKPDEHYARITVNVTDEEGQAVRGVYAYLQDVETGDFHQHVRATPRGHQRSGRDGRFEDREIRPTITPVELNVGPGDPNSPYVLRGTDTEPFMIESRKSYHFDVVLPYKRQMTVCVVDPNGRPLEGVSVSVLEREYASPVFPLWPRTMPSDADGRAEVSQMQPGENVLIALRRLDPSAPDPWNPLVCSLVPATAAWDRGNPLVPVVFDDRPITIEGRVRLDSAIRGDCVFVYVTGQRGDLRGMSIVRTRMDDQGEFLLRGVPAGTIRLMYSVIGSDDVSHRDDAMMTVEPGCRYRVEFTEQGLSVLDRERIP
ncbi:MAG: hypothetical protein KBE65_01150 [Phycisphaerae bacterium]|nr:hypothetical protein [Phycisphaerae bacterium]